MFSKNIAFNFSKKISLLLFLFFLFSCNSNVQEKEIKLGAILPLTGEAAVYGQNCKNGILLAVQEINKSGGIRGDSLKVVFEDSQLMPKVAVNVFNHLVSVEKVVAIIGPLSSSNAMATAPLANENRIISFSPGASTPKLTEAGPYVYRNWQSDALEAQVMAEFAMGRGWKNYGVFYVNNDFGLSLKEYFVKTIEDKGGRVKITESFEQNKSDYKSQLSKIKAADLDALYLLSYPQQTPVIVNQMKALNIEAKILGVAAMEDPSLIEIAGKNANGIIYTIAKPLSDKDPKRIKFIENYKKKFGEEPGLISDTGYDAVYILTEAIKNADTISREGIHIALDKIEFFEGASGPMEFDEHGDVVKPIGIKQIKNNEFEWLIKSTRK